MAFHCLCLSTFKKRGKKSAYEPRIASPTLILSLPIVHLSADEHPFLNLPYATKNKKKAVVTRTLKVAP